MKLNQLINVKRFLSLILFLYASFSFAVNNPMSWQSEMYDCDTMKYNGEYYFSGNFINGDMLISRDLRNWGWRTHVFSYNNSWHSGTDRDIHGSHMRYENGVFHYYAHLETADGITHATNPVSVLGPYSEPVTAHNFAMNIDSDTFKDDDGSFTFYSTKFISGESIYSYPMSDLFTLGSATQRITPSTGDGSNINEASKVFKYRDKYYMLYNTYDTVNFDYRIRGIEATSPTGFDNAGKYTDPIIVRKTLDATREIVRIGQPWMVEGPNGFERWIGYFAHVATSGTITEQGQYIDRLFFLGDDMKADAPTHRDSTGYHPPPASPNYLGLFNGSDGPLPTELTYGAGAWNVVDKELRQTTASGFGYVVVDTNRADNFLVEANVKFITGDKAGIVLFQSGSDWIRVGLDRVNGSWYYHKMSDGTESITGFPLNASFNFTAYHKIQLQKNGNTIYIKIDDIPATGVSETTVNFDGSADTELYTDNAQVAFDGVVYTIGWDEWNGRVQSWGSTKSGVPQVGTWNYGNWGIDQLETNGTKYTFKGDLMDEYEIDARCAVRTANANAGRRIGIMPVAIDGNNYMIAEVDPATTQLYVAAVTNGVYVGYSPVAIPYDPTPGSWNIRAAKLKDKVIIFVNGRELLTANLTYAAAQVGLITENQDAIFSTMLVYETKNETLPTPWQETDLGTVKYPGRVDFTENFITINGGGRDFWDTSDDGHFVYQQINCNKEIIAKVEMLDPASYWTKAAVMIRESLDSNSKMAHICLTKMDANNTNSAQFIYRTTAGAGTPVDSLDRYKMFPSYIKLSRVGNVFSAYWSADGDSWEIVGSTYISMNQNCYIGLGVTANNNDRFTGAVFSDVKIQDVPDASTNVVAYWQFEEGTNGWRNDHYQQDWYYDSTGNGNYLWTWDATTSPLYINGVLDKYIPLTGEENKLAIYQVPYQDLYVWNHDVCSHNFSDGWTVEATVKFNRNDIWQVALGKDGQPRAGMSTDAEFPTFAIKARADNQIIDVSFIDGNKNRHTLWSTTTIIPGTWYKIAAVCNGSTAKLFIKEPSDLTYELESSVTGVSGGALFNENNTWTVGRGMWNGGNADWADQYIDEIRISDTALEVSQFLGTKNLTLPFVNLTNDNIMVENIVSQYTIGGTNNSKVIGTMSWLNADSGSSGGISATANWIISDIPLVNGTNVITVTGTNICDKVSSDEIIIVRAVPEPGLYLMSIFILTAVKNKLYPES